MMHQLSFVSSTVLCCILYCALTCTVVSDNEWEPMPPNNESLDNITVRSSLDPFLDLVVPDADRVKITRDCVDKLPFVRGTKRLLRASQDMCDDRIKHIEKMLDEELEELREAMERAEQRAARNRDMAHKMAKKEQRRILKEMEVDINKREFRLADAALIIGSFQTIPTTEPCTMCMEDITDSSLRLHGCGHHFHFSDECISLLLSRSNCPNCRTHYKSLNTL
jgi:hypothetical protein